jgi:2-oxoglutarate dehydrogenase E2 component (dihydrolipoamide succinyltransferase)
MATNVTMPQLGETVTEGTILRWAKQVGDSIATDEVLVEISTDKVDTEVPSPVSGTVLEILVAEGETVGVGTALAVIGEAGEGSAPIAETPSPQVAPAEPPQPPPTPQAVDHQVERQTEAVASPPESPAPEPPAPEPAPPQPETPEPDAPAPQPSQAPTRPEGNGGSAQGSQGVLSPVVRRLAREHDVDLRQVKGSGEGGRITRRDIESYVSQQVAPAAATPKPAQEEATEAAPVPPGAPITEAPAPTPATRPAPTAPARMAPPAPEMATGSEDVPLDRLRLRVGENMLKAKQSAAHVWTSVEVDYERVERVRQERSAQWKEDEGFSLTYLPFIARAAIDALKAFPVVNSSFYLEEKKATYHRSVNLGIAIDLNQKGLIVATIRNADGLRLVGLARKIRELAERARAGKLDPDDVSGSTFTITNPGPYGSFMSAPIINVPNTGILSTDTVSKRPAVVTTPEGQDTLAIRHIGYLGLSWDHRAFDGSTAVLFLQRIRQNLEGWDWQQELT